jgi:very-short-patch-repair endonuclease
MKTDNSSNSKPEKIPTEYLKNNEFICHDDLNYYDKRNSKNYFSLPYNPKLVPFAKKLRKSGNLSEVLIWNCLKNKKFKHLDFDRQKIIGNYIVDFYCPNLQIVIEIDGSSHNEKEIYDEDRDVYLMSLGLRIIHIEDISVLNNLNLVIQFLDDHPFFAV